MSKIEVNAIEPQCGQTLTIGASDTNIAGIGTVNWDTTAKTADFTAVSGRGYFVNTTSGAITVTLPATPSAGDIVAIRDYAQTFQTNNLTVGRNSSPIDGESFDLTLNTKGTSVTLVYVDATQGWKSVSSNDQVNQELYVAATGGTITTCGDFKIHTFTSPGTFTVTCKGNPAGSNTVDYLVVAGGGGGGVGRGGGGGGGGYRLGSSVSPSPALAAPALSVTDTAYPITVGAGGTGGGPGSPFTPCTPSPGGGSPGSNSIFSTITSAGGGSDSAPRSVPNANVPIYRPDFNGGSGAGGMGRGYGSPGGDKGTGNTPPVSPPQGNPGGDGSTVNSAPGASSYQGGGGGGAGAAGSDGTPNATPSPASGAGGDGSNEHTPTFGANPQPFYPSPDGYFSGGGGGSGGSGPSYPGAPNVSDLGNGGAGGGADGETIAQGGRNGTTNSGGGASGGGLTGSPFVNASGGTGGSGIVIIRYKYQ